MAESAGSGPPSLPGTKAAARPLAGVGVLVTRPARQAGPFAQQIAALGGSPVIFPAIVILPPADSAALAALHARLHEFDVAIFVSANAAEFGLPASGRWPDALPVYAPGPGTAEALAALGIAEPRIPRTTQDSEGLLALPGLADLRGRRVVIFRGDGGRELLGDTLRERGAQVEYGECYRRARPASAAGLDEAFRERRIDVVTVTSSEGIDNLWTSLDPASRAAWRAVTTLAPHPRIAARARELGLDAIRTAAGDAGLLAGLLEWNAQRRARSATPMSAEILVTAPLPPFLYTPLQATYRCHDHVAASDPAHLLATEGPRIRGLVQGGATVTPAALLAALPKLEIISVFGVGYDGVPVEYCRQRGIMVTNTPDVLTDDVADVATALVLMTSRGLVAAERFLRAGEWLRGGPVLTHRLGGKRVGILGLGRIGKAIAHRLEAMGMDIAYTGRSPQAGAHWRFVPTLLALAAEVDFLVVACPGGAATRHIVDAGVLAALGAEGTLINIARGSIVDEPALVAALQFGTIKAAGLDAFADEPRVPAALLGMDNVVLLPHVGSATQETRQAMADLCRANLDAWFAGKAALTPIPELD